MYASNAGKSGGELFTPADVSELLTRLGTVGKNKVNKVYDPACGSGSLVLRAIKILKGGVELGLFGQEINVTTYNLCRINMFLNNINPDKFHVPPEVMERVKQFIDASTARQFFTKIFSRR